MLNEEEEESVKLILIGDAGVGKSSIISRYLNNEFDENKVSSVGGSFCTKTIKIGDKQVELGIWDTAGQEIYRSVAKYFYKNAKLVCLVCDITNKDSFINLKDYWYLDFQENGEKSSIFAVVCNKSDLIEKEEINEAQAREFAKEINAIFVLTSAQNGTGIDDLFKSLAEKYLSPEHEPIVNEIKKERSLSFNLKNQKNDGCCKKKKCC